MANLRSCAAAVVCGWFLLSVNALPAQESGVRVGTTVPVEVETIYDRGLQWLAQNQLPSGDWCSGGGAQDSGIKGMCVMAFLASGEDPNFGRYALHIRRAVQSIIRSQDVKTGYIPNSMYHHGFAMLALSEVYGALDDDLLHQQAVVGGNRRSIGKTLELAVRLAVTAQKKNRWGGWRYSPQSTDADTSVSGAMLMGLLAARNAGIKVPDETIDKALDYFKKMTSPQGGVGYSGGFGGLGGSKNLQAIATLVNAVGKRKHEKKYAATLGQLSSSLEHRESGYPFYFRYYMAQALFQGDYEAWQKWNRLTTRQLSKLQQADGHFKSGHGDAYGTSMSLLALALNYRFLPIYER